MPGHSLSRRRVLEGGAAAVVAAGLSSVFQGSGARAAASTVTGAGASVTADLDDTSDAIFYSDGWTAFTGVAGRTNGTAHSTMQAGAVMSYTHARCTRIQWRGPTDPQHGTADVYVDGVHVTTVDTYSPTLANDVVIFDTGELPAGCHTIKAVTHGQAGPIGGGAWVEVDSLRVEAEANAPDRVNDDNTTVITYSFPGWSEVSRAGFTGADVHSSDMAGATADFAFTGSAIGWVGSRQADGGIAEVFLDGVLAATVDTYQARTHAQAVLFEKSGLTAGVTHQIRIQVTGRKNHAASGAYVHVDAFDVTGSTVASGTTALGALQAQVQAELAQIRAGTKPYLAPDDWHPVPHKTSPPAAGVTLLADPQGSSGPMKTAFENGIAYLKYSYGLTNWVSFDSQWDENWPDSNEARMLLGTANSLRWVQDADLRTIMDTIIAANVARQQPDGFVMQWPEASMPDATVDEQANYDRAMWTRGMVAAIGAGSADAATVLRRFYDWFNAWVFSRIADPSQPKTLLECSMGVQGHIGSTLTYLSPVGVADDLVAAERYYVQDYFLDHLAERDPLVLWRYPLNRPTGYLLTAGQAFLDEYTATGARKYLDGSLGMWDLFERDWMYTAGGGNSLCEVSTFPPGSYALPPHLLTNEGCCAVFWADFSSRLLQHFPQEEKYAAQIERAIYNTCLANQESAAPHAIRYHANLHGQKETGSVVNTCDEVTETGLYARLPQFLYSVADDGLSINMYESSQITWQHHGSAVSLTTTTGFPYDMAVSHQLSVPSGHVSMALRIRIPRWATAAVAVHVNGRAAGSGQPGSYLTLSRGWADGDTISYTLPAGFRLTEYTGFDQSSNYKRYGLEHGPLLYALVGDWDSTYSQPGGATVPRIAMTPDELIAALTPSATPGEYTIDGVPGFIYRPYMTVQDEQFTVYPIIHKTLSLDITPASVFVGDAGGSATVTVQATSPLPAAATDVSIGLLPPAGWTATPASTGPSTLKPGTSGSWGWQLTAPADAAGSSYHAVLTMSYTSGGKPTGALSQALGIGFSNWVSVATMTASSTFSPSSPANLSDGNTDSSVWGDGGAGGWNDNTEGVFPDWVTATWTQLATLSRVVVYTLDSASFPASEYGVSDYDVQVLTASGDWDTVAQVRGNTAGVITSTFAQVQTTALRISILDSNDHSYSRLIQVEAFTA